jgi:5-methylcytosine-specific restriction protein A
MESWGGPNPNGRLARNPDYNRALELLLARLGGIEAKIQLCLLDSRPAQVQPLYERQLSLPKHPYPIDLSAIADFDGLRFEIRSAQRIVGGNGGSRIRLRFSLPRPCSVSLLETFLVSPGTEVISATDLWTEVPTADPELLDARVKIAHAKMSALSGTVLLPPPGSAGGKQTSGAVQRFIRDPNIIAWVLERANGTCEVCKKSAPFQRSNGNQFLEVHHVRTLAEGGPDTVDNTLAACPNCHRELHFGINREVLRAGVIAGIARLVDHPQKTLITDQSETAAK